jgi:hypothetical protein
MDSVSVKPFLLRRRCLALVSAFLSPCLLGCLDEPPVYEGQERLPPYIVMASVIPNPGKLTVVEDGTMSVEVPFRSEDLDETVTAVFSVDAEYASDFEYGDSVFADTTRRVEEVVELSEGCHLVELMLTHTDNVPRPGQEPITASLAAFVYWWAVVPSDEGDVHCPQ